MKSFDHIDHLLQDYLDGDLDDATAGRVKEHLERCAACRAEWESLRALVADVQALPRSVDPPRDLWDDIRSRLEDVAEHPSPAAPTPSRQELGDSVPARVRRRHRRSDAPKGRRPWQLRSDAPKAWRGRLVGAAVIVLAAAAVIWMVMRSGEGGWDVETLSGAPVVGSRQVSAQGVLRRGDWLETDGGSRARLRIGAIGDVEVEPNTRLQLREASLNDHRIALAEGRIEARIWAPPRLFFVETPSATAIDLGCAYTLTVDSTGKSLLHVTSGYVELQKEGRSSVVPAGAMCYASPEQGPGTAFVEDAPEALRDALVRFDFGGARDEDLAVVLDRARTGDAITLWQLVERTDGSRRAKIYDRLAMLVRPPSGVSREGVLRGDADMFEMWRLHLGLDALSWWGYLREKMAFPDEQ